EIEFDFVDHDLVLRTSDGRRGTVALEPRSVASFYGATMDALRDLDVRVTILARPVEIAEGIPFPAAARNRPSDPAPMNRFWRALVQAHRVMTVFRAHYVGKVSPVHLFWGGLDLAVTRFSGRTAPTHPGGVPNIASWVNEVAYTHEVSSCGFWPDGSSEGSF